MDWDKLRVYHVVAEAGNLTHAGEILNLSQSAVSRQISALEENIPQMPPRTGPDDSRTGRSGKP
jgi:DNA-binding transcriptional LysR family regulator